jgi:hypothetical protein
MTPTTLRAAAGARLTRNQVAAAAGVTYHLVRYYEGVHNVTLRRERRVWQRGGPRAGLPSVSEICGCGLRWVPLVAGTRCSLCVGAR